MPLQSTSGAASYDAFGGGVAAVPKYIEDYFSTFLFSGTGSDQTITNNIDLSTKGGLVWLKKRTYPSGSVTSHYLMDTNRGTSAGYLSSNSTDAENAFDIVSSFNTNGFGFNTPVNDSGDTYTSWSWAKAPKFFDVVTFTTNSSNGATFAHNLGSVPGCLIVKSLASADSWIVWHRGLTGGIDTNVLVLNATNGQFSIGTTTTATSTTITIGNGSLSFQNAPYVAYLFAHNAGGFGLTGTDNVISCGSYTSSGSEVSVDLGYEPQWMLVKRSSSTSNWVIRDTMRGNTVGGNAQQLYPDLSNAEDASTGATFPTATGFVAPAETSGRTYIYIAIRRGPMVVPTSGTSVFEPVIYTGNNSLTRVINTTITPDAAWFFHRDSANGEYWFDRLRGGGKFIRPSQTDAESTLPGAWLFDVQNAVQMNSPDYAYLNASGALNGLWAMKRAPSFFDEVCYTGGNSTNQRVTHNLGVAPEFIISKTRSTTGSWFVYSQSQGISKYGALDDSGPFNSFALWGTSAPTSTDFGINSADIGYNGQTIVAYLFATCAGVSKVGSYTGTGTTLQVNCGFTGGARFVLIKRTDDGGDWYVWDSARGIVAGNDPYLLLNSTAAEVTNTDYVDTYSAGFEITSTAPAAINASGGTFIFLAIA